MAAEEFRRLPLPLTFPVDRRQLEDRFALHTGSKFDGNSNALQTLLGRPSASGTQSQGALASGTRRIWVCDEYLPDWHAEAECVGGHWEYNDQVLAWPWTWVCDEYRW